MSLKNQLRLLRSENLKLNKHLSMNNSEQKFSALKSSKANIERSTYHKHSGIPKPSKDASLSASKGSEQNVWRIHIFGSLFFKLYRHKFIFKYVRY